MVFARQSECLRTTHSHQNFKSLVPRKITQHTGIVWVIFDNQQDCIIGLQIVAVVRNLLDRMFRDDGQGRWRHRRWILSLHHGSARRAHIGLWQVEDEGAPLTGSAPQLDFSTEEAGQFAADRQPQTCSTVLTAGAGVCLLESLEDDPLLVQRNANAGIGNFKGHNRSSLPQDGVTLAPAARSQRRRQADASQFGELEGVGQQILQYLLQTLRVGDDAPGQVRIGLHLETETAVLGFMPERTFHHVQQTGKIDFLCLHRYGPGFDLRQIKNVGDQVQQVCPGAMNRAGELNLFWRQVSIRVIAELLAQDQDAVKWRAQLMRHVSQELRLVLGGQSQLLRLLFQGAAGLLDFLVFALDLNVLFGELLRFLRELLVCLL